MSMQLHVARERDGRDLTATSTSPQQAWAHEENDLRERVEGLEALLLECQERMDEAEGRAKAAESQVPAIFLATLSQEGLCHAKNTPLSPFPPPSPPRNLTSKLNFAGIRG